MLSLKSQVVLLQTAHSWANGVTQELTSLVRGLGFKGIVRVLSLGGPECFG